MTVFPSPVTDRTLKNRFSGWLEIIKRNESGSILNLSNREQLWRIDQFKALLKKQVLSLNLNALAIEDEEEFENYLFKKIDKKKTLILLILGADRLLDEKQYLTPYLNALPRKMTHCSILFFFQKNIFLPNNLKKLSLFSNIYQNIQHYPLYERKDMKQFITYLENKFSSNLPEMVKNSILSACEGNLWFVKEVVRYYIKTHNTKHLFDHEEMLLRLSICFNEFEKEEIRVFEKVIVGETDFANAEKRILDYFVKTNWLRFENKSYILTIPILENYIKKQLSDRNRIYLNDNQQIAINGVVVNHFFSRREKLILLHFLADKGLTTREKVASIVWGKHYMEQYTDWALDQFMKRLRNKITRLGLNRNLIKTVKNQGFVFQNTYGN